MRLYSPVDLTGIVNMIEKLVLGGTEGRTLYMEKVILAMFMLSTITMYVLMY